MSKFTVKVVFSHLGGDKRYMQYCSGNAIEADSPMSVAKIVAQDIIKDDEVEKVTEEDLIGYEGKCMFGVVVTKDTGDKYYYIVPANKNLYRLGYFRYTGDTVQV
jgi:phage FluMu gp28-like protein